MTPEFSQIDAIQESLASIAQSLEFFRKLAVAGLEHGAKTEPDIAEILAKLKVA